MTAPSTPDHRPASAARRDRFIARRLIPGAILVAGVILLAIGGGLAPLGVAPFGVASRFLAPRLLTPLGIASPGRTTPTRRTTPPGRAAVAHRAASSRTAETASGASRLGTCPAFGITCSATPSARAQSGIAVAMLPVRSRSPRMSVSGTGVR